MTPPPSTSIRTSMIDAPARVTHRRMYTTQTAQELRPPWVTDYGYEKSPQVKSKNIPENYRPEPHSLGKACVRTQTTAFDGDGQVDSIAEVERNAITLCGSLPQPTRTRELMCTATQTEPTSVEETTGPKFSIHTSGPLGNALVSACPYTSAYLVKLDSSGKKWSKDSKSSVALNNRPPFYPPGPTTTTSTSQWVQFGSVPNFNRLDRIRQARDLYSRPKTRKLLYESNRERSKSIPNLIKCPAAKTNPSQPSNQVFTVPSLASSINAIDLGGYETQKLTGSSPGRLSRSMLSIKNVETPKNTHGRSQMRPFWSTVDVMDLTEPSVPESNLPFWHTGSFSGDNVDKIIVKVKPPLFGSKRVSAGSTNRRAVSLSNSGLIETGRSEPSAVTHRVNPQNRLKQLYTLQIELQRIIDRANDAVQSQEAESIGIQQNHSDCRPENTHTQSSIDSTVSIDKEESNQQRDMKFNDTKWVEGFYVEKSHHIYDHGNEGYKTLKCEPSKHVSVLRSNHFSSSLLGFHFPLTPADPPVSAVWDTQSDRVDLLRLFSVVDLLSLPNFKAETKAIAAQDQSNTIDGDGRCGQISVAEQPDRTRSRSRGRKILDAAVARISFGRSRSKSVPKSNSRGIEISGPIVGTRITSEMFGPSGFLTQNSVTESGQNNAVGVSDSKANGQSRLPLSSTGPMNPEEREQLLRTPQSWEGISSDRSLISLREPRSFSRHSSIRAVPQSPKTNATDRQCNRPTQKTTRNTATLIAKHGISLGRSILDAGAKSQEPVKGKGGSQCMLSGFDSCAGIHSLEN
ncbi:hypothetical protein D915_004324 [Fasciola hepatica]|uniref:Uncharacterized protein n=1 Tax=Fasciola hepatica TaxID=6192 RepID=A0A4E0RBU9_FASHE|nr:hypothetical protein D915_004324 [Fasciola hepatica]